MPIICGHRAGQETFHYSWNVFHLRNSHFRLAFAVSEEKLGRAIEILNELARAF